MPVYVIQASSPDPALQQVLDKYVCNKQIISNGPKKARQKVLACEELFSDMVEVTALSPKKYNVERVDVIKVRR